MRNFRFKLNGTQCYPIYSDEVSKDITLYNGEQFYREEIGGSFTFVKDDFDLIDALAFNSEVAFLIELDEGAGYNDYFVGYFFKKDCEIHYNEGKKQITVTPMPNDKYRLLLEGMEREFNLIDLSPARYKLKFVKQGVIQVWTYPSNYMTNITRGNFWVRRVDIQELDSVRLREQYKFGFKIPTGTELFIPGDAVVLNPDVGGFYTYDTYERTSDSAYALKGIGSGTLELGGTSPFDVMPTNDPYGFSNLRLEFDTCDFHDYDDFESVWSWKGLNVTFLGVEYDNINLKYYAYFRGTSVSGYSGASGTITHVSGATNTGTKTYTNWTGRNYDLVTDNPYSFIKSDGFSVETDETKHWYVVRWAIANNITPTTFDNVYLAPTRQQLTTYPELDQEGPLFQSLTTGSKCRVIINIFYQRLLTDNRFINGVETERISDVNDVQRSELGYKYAIPKEYEDFEVTDINTSTPTRYGKFNESAANYGGEYFDEFTSGNWTIPINRPDWKEASVWMDIGAGKLADIQSGDLVRELRHSYRLSEVISDLLAEIDPALSFAETTVYSDFLFNSTNPVSGEAFPILFISPKSNVLQGEYTKEATRALIKIGEILELLRIAFNCYWYIDDSNRLRIEHVRWFLNGGHYTTEQISFDLTTQRQYKTNYLWSEEQNIVTYDKLELPEIVRMRWMDEQSPAFDGLDIKSEDTYVSKGVIEERVVTKFSTDLDYMQLEAESMNPDGFTLLGAFQSAVNSEWLIPFKEVDIIGNWQYDLQNGYLSNMYLQKNFHLDNAQSSNLLINDQSTVANSIKRVKRQNVSLPNLGAFDPLELMTTDQGNGKVEKASINLQSNYMTVELKHETS